MNYRPVSDISTSLPFLLAFLTFVRKAESLPVLARRVVKPISKIVKKLGLLSLFYFHVHVPTQVNTKEDIKDQPTSRNLSATTTKVLQCTCPVAASRKDFSAIHTSTSPHLTLTFNNNIILHLFLVLCTSVNVRNKN